MWREEGRGVGEVEAGIERGRGGEGGRGGGSGEKVTADWTYRFEMLV